ncbi:hypothetical protein MPL3356_60568 [Mesorhizobium plurifarium]|uniref:Uncharacterized protein n=1 Tax=Mesorhizobium plurifarium TaxID=69974 RepID=A0A090EFU2_MESPL|nr:hypothetical protein MPL3356_60568 [Mesorhizobium plurifarium]
MIALGPLVVLIIIGAVVAIGLIPARPEDHLLDFRAKCRKDGLTFQETEAALGARIAFVSLRRRASNLCVDAGGHVTRDQINEIARHLAIGLAASHGQDAAKRFIAWVESCPDEEILYDDARGRRHHRISGELARKGLHANKKAAMHEDFKHALKVIKR